MITISLDAMGGDHAPDAVVEGANIALQHSSTQLRFIFFGDEARVEPLLQKYPQVKAVSTLIHTDVMIGMEDKPSQALRRGRRCSSMWLTLDAVREGKADIAVSSGNTGALMAMSKVCLKTISMIDRPAIAVLWPSMNARGQSIVLDVGATIGADAQQLFAFALMGEAMARALFNLERPTVGLLNIGVEEMKGLEEVQSAHRILKESSLPMQYMGFVEGDDLSKGTVDVVVTEGFCGNIALKTAEGTADYLTRKLISVIKQHRYKWLLQLVIKLAFGKAMEQATSRMRGGVFLGLNGLVIKSHGGADARGFAGAIQVGHNMVRSGLLAKIENDLDQYHGEHNPIVAAKERAVKKVLIAL